MKLFVVAHSSYSAKELREVVIESLTSLATEKEQEGLLEVIVGNIDFDITFNYKNLIVFEQEDMPPQITIVDLIEHCASNYWGLLLVHSGRTVKDQYLRAVAATREPFITVSSMAKLASSLEWVFDKLVYLPKKKELDAIADQNPRIAGVRIEEFCCKELYVFYVNFLFHWRNLREVDLIRSSLVADELIVRDGTTKLPVLKLHHCPNCGKPQKKLIEVSTSVISPDPHI